MLHSMSGVSGRVEIKLNAVRLAHALQNADGLRIRGVEFARDPFRIGAQSLGKVLVRLMNREGHPTCSLRQSTQKSP